MAIVVFVIAGVVQAGLYYHGVQRAEAAADRAVTVASLQNGTTDAGRAAAEDFLAGAPVDDATVSVVRTAERTTAQVTGRAPQLIPITWRIVAHSEAPTERFVPETERP